MRGKTYLESMLHSSRDWLNPVWRNGEHSLLSFASLTITAIEQAEAYSLIHGPGSCIPVT